VFTAKRLKQEKTRLLAGLFPGTGES